MANLQRIIPLLTLGVLLALWPSISQARPPATDNQESIFKRFQVNFALDAAAPLLFRDTKDRRTEATRVFHLGGRVGFLFGDPRVDLHRFGIGVGIASVARSESRHLMAIDPHALLSVGRAFNMQLGLGFRAAAGTEGFRENYGGLLGSLELRYSFLPASDKGKVSITPAVFASFILTPKQVSYSSAFIGARIELAIHKN